MPRPRTIARVLIRAAACLVIGVVASVVVASVLLHLALENKEWQSMGGANVGTKQAPEFLNYEAWSGVERLHPPFFVGNHFWPLEWGPELDKPAWYCIRRGDFFSHYATGWPRRCLRAWEDIDSYFPWPTKAQHASLWLIGGAQDAVVLLPSSTTRTTLWPIAIPTSPYWPGLIFNTLFYALPLFLLWTCVPLARRAVRQKRGLCPKCAYSRSALPADQPCPECGTPGQPPRSAYNDPLRA